MAATAPQRGTCRVEVYFDPACPVSWLVTRWLLEVQPHRNLDLVHHVTSPMLVNAGRALDADYHALLAWPSRCGVRSASLSSRPAYPPPWPTPQMPSGTTRRSRPTPSRQHVGSARARAGTTGRLIFA